VGPTKFDLHSRCFVRNYFHFNFRQLSVISIQLSIKINIVFMAAVDIVVNKLREYF
jgi:hypothetical protein